MDDARCGIEACDSDSHPDIAARSQRLKKNLRLAERDRSASAAGLSWVGGHQQVAWVLAGDGRHGSIGRRAGIAGERGLKSAGQREAGRADRRQDMDGYRVRDVEACRGKGERNVADSERL